MTQLPSSSARIPGTVPGWLKDRPFDLFFIVGIVAIASAMAGLTMWQPALFVPVLTVHIWLFGYDHLIATYTKLAGLPEDRARHRWLLLYVPPLVLAAIALTGQTQGVEGLYTAYFFAQFYHTVRQSWGLAQQYRHRAGGLPDDPVWLSELTLWSIPAWGFLHRCTQAPVEFLSIAIWLPPVPGWLAHLTGLLAVALWLYWLATRIHLYRRGKLPLAHTLYLISHAGVYLFGYVLIGDLDAGWLLVNVWHNVQYLAFVWLANRRRFAPGVVPAARALSWLAQPGLGRGLLFYLTCFLLAIPINYGVKYLGGGIDSLHQTGPASYVVILSLSLTFHHYIVDAVVWKRRNNPPAA